MILITSFVAWLQPLAACFTEPSFQSLLLILPGWVLAPRRTLTGILLAARAVGRKHHSAFYRLFSQASWSLDEVGLIIAGMILKLLPDPVLLAVDDTLAHKKGLKVYGAGMHHDPLLSSKKKALMNYGHCWVLLGLILPVPCCPDRFFCLPVLFGLYRSQQTVARERGAYKTKPQLAVELLEALCGRFADRRFHGVTDSAYGGKSVLLKLPNNCHWTSRLHLDARLYDAPPARKPGQRGRPRKRGALQPSPRAMLQGRCRRETLNLYGRHDQVCLADTVARWHNAPALPLRVVAVEPLTGGRDVQAFYSTDADRSALAVLALYAKRWSIEQAIQESKGHLGFEEPQGWSKQAVLRTAPLAMLLYSLIVLWFRQDGHGFYQPLERPWYISKHAPSFADMLATLRVVSAREQIIQIPSHSQAKEKTLEILLQTLKLAA